MCKTRSQAGQSNAAFGPRFVCPSLVLLIAEGEKMERIIEYLDPASTQRNVVAVVSGVTPEQKARALKLLGVK